MRERFKGNIRMNMSEEVEKKLQKTKKNWISAQVSLFKS